MILFLYIHLESDKCKNIQISDIEVFEFDDIPTSNNLYTQDLFQDETLYTFDEIGILIRPRLVDIGCRLNDRIKAGRVIFEPKVFQMSFVPLSYVLKTMLQDCNLFEVIIEFMNRLESNSNKCVSNFVQCKLWKSKLEKNPQKILLPLFLYFDDFEINNALGSHAGNNKLGAVYASLPCLPPEYSSSLENIFLACLFI